MVGQGIGATPYISLLKFINDKDILIRNNPSQHNNQSLKKVDFLWMVKNQETKNRLEF